MEAKTVINCANVRAPELAKLVGEDVPVISERHQALVTEPVAPLIDCMVMSFARSYYVQQTPHGSFVMGIGPKAVSYTHLQQTFACFLRNRASAVPVPNQGISLSLNIISPPYFLNFPIAYSAQCTSDI